MKTQKEMIYELHQVVIGLKDNPHDNGLVGEIKDIALKIDTLNGRVRGNEVRSKVNQGILGTLGGGGILGLLGKILGWF